MSRQDPYAEFGGQYDPYEEFGGTFETGPQEISPTLLESRKAASKSEFEANLPRYQKEATGLDPFTSVADFQAGVERAAGLDPMHPISSAPGAIANAAKGIYTIVTKPGAGVQMAKDIVAGIGEAAGKLTSKESTTPEKMEAAGELYGTLRPLAGPVKGVVKKPIDYVKGRIAYRQQRPFTMRTPEGHLWDALKPDLDSKELSAAGDQLKSAEDLIKKPIKDIDSLKEGLETQFEQELYPQRRAIIDHSGAVNQVVPGSAQRLIDAKIKSIPSYIQKGTPTYDALIEQFKTEYPHDLTLGELESHNSSLNKVNRAFHKAGLSQAMAIEERARGAGLIAAENEGRALMYDGTAKLVSPGARLALKEINARIGRGIKLQDAADTMEVEARTQATQPRLGREASRLARTGVGLIYRNVGREASSINENIANSMRKWPRRSQPVGWTASTRSSIVPPGARNVTPPKTLPKGARSLLPGGSKQLPGGE